MKAHLLTQNCKALSAGNECLYRAPGGLKCAIGVLIPDDKYQKDFEGQDAVSPMEDTMQGTVTTIMRAAGLTLDNVELVLRLQTLHDKFAVRQWLDQLDAIEAQFLSQEDTV